MEKYLILHCSPTLAGIKAANLFSYTFLSEAALMESLLSINKILNPKGVYAEILHIKDGRVLIFVYRKSLLTADIMRKGVKEFLGLCGYNGTIDNFIQRLKSRFNIRESFPMK